MTQSDEIMQVVSKSIEMANKIGYEQGAADVRGRVMNVVKNYSDVASSPLFTALDAFHLVLRALIEEDDIDGEA
jgi:hypothetical protein